MSDLDRRLAKLETSYQQPEAPRVLILDELPDGRLVDPFTRDDVAPRPQDTVIVIRSRPDGPQ